MWSRCEISRKVWFDWVETREIIYGTKQRCAFSFVLPSVLLEFYVDMKKWSHAKPPSAFYAKGRTGLEPY